MTSIERGSDTITAGDQAMPYGLSWTRRLINQSAMASLSVGERFQVMLAVGIFAIAATVFLCCSVLCLFFDDLAELSALLIVPAAGFLLAIGMVAKSADKLVVTTHISCAFFIFNTWCSAIYGIHWGVAPTFAMPVLFAALLIGHRAAVMWLVLSLLGLALMVGAESIWEIPISPSAFAVSIWNHIVMAVALTAALTWFTQLRDIAEADLERERQKNQELLENILPNSVVTRLKAGNLVADHHPDVSVLFADLVGFTWLSSTLSPGDLLQMLSELFRTFDALTTKHGVEKIKTIGDCYMVASGVPTATQIMRCGSRG